MKHRTHKDPARYTPHIDAELDLHGYRADEARSAAADFLHHAQAEGYERVRIIVGKGTRSADGPVLPTTIKALLRTYGYDYTYAKFHEGGEGALDIRIA